MVPKLNVRSWIGIPPWIIIGALIVLVPIFVFMTLESINREKEIVTERLVEKGAALIRSFEAGARTGMMGMQWGGQQLQRLLTETAKQPDIVYLFVTDVQGNILAHSESSRVGKTHGSELDLEQISHSQTLKWRQVTDQGGRKIFEVYRQFSPIRGDPHGHHHRMMRHHWGRSQIISRAADGNGLEVIFVGLDLGPVEAARKEDIRHSILMGLILLLIGFAGIVSLFLAQAYRSARTSLSRVKAFSDNLVENMPIGLVALDSDVRIASFNQTAEAILQLESKEVLGKHPKEVLPAGFPELIDSLNSERGLVENEMRCKVSEDRTVPLEVIATALTGEEGDPLGYVVLFRDLSEIQHLKQEVARSQRLAAVGKLAAGVAHEIRNPLSSIKGFATYFQERYREVPEDQRTAQIMIQEVERLNRVIGQLLEFAKPLRIQKAIYPLPKLVEESVKMIEADARHKGIDIDVRISTDINEARLDADRMKQVLLNLYLNAIEAMQEGGTLSVELKRDQNSDLIEIVVSDTGAGIKEEDLAHIFDPYFTTKPSGTGLGLAIVHKIIESHGGEMRVTSRLGDGTKVSVSFPCFTEDIP